MKIKELMNNVFDLTNNNNKNIKTTQLSNPNINFSK